MKTKHIFTIIISLLCLFGLNAEENTFYLIDSILNSPYDTDNSSLFERNENQLETILLFSEIDKEIFLIAPEEGLLIQDDYYIKYITDKFSLLLPSIYFIPLLDCEVKKGDSYAKIDKNILIQKKLLVLNTSGNEENLFPQFNKNKMLFFNGKKLSNIIAITDGVLKIKENSQFPFESFDTTIITDNYSYLYFGLKELFHCKENSFINSGETIGFFGGIDENGFSSPGFMMAILDNYGVRKDPIIIYLVR